MTLAKIVVTGTVKKNPEKRFTQNNMAVCNLIVDIAPEDETLIRVMVFGAQADKIADTIKMGDNVIVDGRLQMENVKTQSGKEKKVATINASQIEKTGAQVSSNAQSAPKKDEAVVQFSTDELAEDLIDPEEIPF